MKKRFSIVRWIMLSLAVLSNAFIIFNSCLTEEATNTLNKPFTNAFITLVNSLTKKKKKKVPVESIDLRLSTNEEYVYNNIPGYDSNEIPIGSAKEIRCSILPVDSSDQSLSFDVSPQESVVLNQSGSIVSVVGMKTGDCTIKVKSHDGSFESSLKIKIVEPVAPINYEASLDKKVKVGEKEILNFDIDGGVLGHDELINSRYFDVRKLTYVSSDNTIATVDDKGIITGVSSGLCNITVSNGDGVIKDVQIEVVDGEITMPYTNLSIKGSSFCYANDMILDQSSHVNHFQLTPKTGETELDPNDFIWFSSNELLAKVDKHGVLRGFRKFSNDEEVVNINAISKKTGQEISCNVAVKTQLPSELVFSLKVGKKEVWSPSTYTVSLDGEVSIIPYFSPYGCDKSYKVTSSNEEVISCIKNGNVVNLSIHSEGVSRITITSVAKTSLYIETTINVVKAGAISSEDVGDVHHSIRKIIGHAVVFMVAQIFTFLTLYMFLYDKKWWFYSSISSGKGFIIAVLSEIIQFFVPTRSGTFKDVLIDLAGVAVGFILSFVSVTIINKAKGKKVTNLNNG